MKRINIKWILVGISMHICACKETPTENKTEQSSDKPKDKQKRLDLNKVEGFYLFSEEEIARFNRDDQLVALAQNMCVTFLKFEYKYFKGMAYPQEWRHERDTFDPAKNFSRRAKRRLAEEFLEDEYEIFKKQAIAYAKRYKELFDSGKYPWYHIFNVAESLQKIANKRVYILRKSSCYVDQEVSTAAYAYENRFEELKRETSDLTYNVWGVSREYRSKQLKEERDNARRYEQQRIKRTQDRFKRERMR